MRACFAERPIFVSTALYEPFGLAVLEAAQAGCALILSSISTFRELWDGAARFVNPRDADAVADAANSLLAEAPAREALGDAARQRARLYGLQSSADATLAWHRDILARRARVETRRSMA
jgi:glycosyltransferase involved in cell wall biosynthesis